MDLELVEEGVGRSMSSLQTNYGIEITEIVNDEVALILQGDLYSTYEVDFEIPHLVADIDYIIREEIY